MNIFKLSILFLYGVNIVANVDEFSLQNKDSTNLQSENFDDDFVYKEKDINEIISNMERLVSHGKQKLLYLDDFYKIQERLIPIFLGFCFVIIGSLFGICEMYFVDKGIRYIMDFYACIVVFCGLTFIISPLIVYMLGLEYISFFSSLEKKTYQVIDQLNKNKEKILLEKDLTKQESLINWHKVLIKKAQMLEANLEFHVYRMIRLEQDYKNGKMNSVYFNWR